MSIFMDIFEIGTELIGPKGSRWTVRSVTLNKDGVVKGYQLKSTEPIGTQRNITPSEFKKYTQV